MSTSERKTAFQLLIYTKTGSNTALAATEWALIRLRRGAPFSRSYRQRSLKTWKGQFTTMKMWGPWKGFRITSLRYNIIARNCIEVRLTTDRPVAFKNISDMIKMEAAGPFITYIKEDIPMLWF